MRRDLLTALVLASLASASAARPHGYSDAYDDDAHRGLRFADLEYAMPADPLLWSTDPGWEPHRTPAAQLHDATERLQAAVPTGTRAEDAAAVLRKAGAKCAPASSPGANLTCTYQDVEFLDGGDYTDNVIWTVAMPLQDRRVASLAVNRIWSRH